MLRKLLTQTALYGLSSVLGRFINYLLVFVYTRVFLPEEYGVISEWYSYIVFLNVIYTYGMETGFFRFYKKNEVDANKVLGTTFYSHLISSGVLTVLAFVFAAPIATALDYPTHPEYVRYFALILALDTLAAIPFAYLRALGRPLAFAAIKLSLIAINVIATVVFLILLPSFFDNKIEAVFMANAISSALVLPWILFYLPLKKIQLDTAWLKKLLPYSLPLLVAGLAGMTNETIDRILLKHLLPYSTAENMAQIGIYSACYKLSIVMTLAVQAFKMSAEPFFFAQAQNKNAPQLYARIMNYFVAVCSVIFLSVLVCMPVFQYFIGEKFRSAIDIVPILLMANLALGVYYNASIWYKLSFKTNYGMYLALFGAFVTLSLNYWLIPIYGFRGAAWVTLACYGSMAVLCFGIGHRYYKVPYNYLKIIGYPLLALCIYAFTRLFGTYPDVQNVIGGFGLLVLLGVIYFVEKPAFRERASL